MMATNPKLPDYPDVPSHRPKDDHARVQMIRQGKFPWPLLALLAGAALLIAIIVALPRAPHVTKPPTAAEVPQQPTAEQIQLTNLKISPAPAGDAVYLTAVLRNTGNSEITGAQIQAELLGRNAPVLATVTRPVEGMD